MPKTKNQKIWNEELLAGLEARHQKSLREGKRDAHTWRNGLEKIQSVRGDIYQFSTGRIVNLPVGLTKTVQRACEDMIKGVKNVYPDGHVPTNGGVGGGTVSSRYGGGGGKPGRSSASARVVDAQDAAWAQYDRVHGGAHPNNIGTRMDPNMHQGGTASAFDKPSASASRDHNPFSHDHYMKHLKIRGGAFAILMAFHCSQTDVLRKAQICREAQKFCDDTMEANYMAGRPHGAWSGIKTLKDHHLVTEDSFRAFTDGGFRDRPHEFTLTRDGKLFIEALFAHRPEAVAASRQAAGVGFTGSFAGGAPAAAASPPHAAPSAPRSSNFSTPLSMNKLSRDDITELERWWPLAEAGERKTFNVGKDRRKHLHQRVDSLQVEHPGLILTHNSLGTGRSRELSIQMVAKPGAAATSSMKRKRPVPHNAQSNFSCYGQSMSETMSPASKRARTPCSNAATPRQNAAEAALRRLELSSRKATANIFEIDEEDEDRQLQRAISESLHDSSVKKHVAEHDGREKTAPTDSMDVLSLDSESDDEELTKPVFLAGHSSRQKHRRRTISGSSSKVARKNCANARHPAENGHKKAAPKASIDVLSLDSASDDEELTKSVFSAGHSSRQKHRRRTTSGSSSKVARKKSANAKHAAENGHKEAAPRASSDVLSLDSATDNEELNTPVFSAGHSSRQKHRSRTISRSSSKVARKKSANAKHVAENGHKEAPPRASIDVLSLDSASDDEELTKPVFSAGHSNRQKYRSRTVRGSSSKVTRKNSANANDDNEVIDIVDHQDEPEKTAFVDLFDSGAEPDDSCANDSDDNVITVDKEQHDTAGSINHELVILIDSRERNRNATPRTLRMELQRHLTSGTMRSVWPPLCLPATVEEVRLDHGDFGFVMVHTGSRERRMIGVSVERKRVNDLVQRSYDGDHLSQLMKMQQKCSLSVLLIEYDTKLSSSVTPYGAQNREGFDPFDTTTITCENDVYLLFGRIMLSSEKIKLIQSKDEQSSLRAVGALGLMSLTAPEDKTKELLSSGGGHNSGDAQSLSDILKGAGIPWRIAKRVASYIGGFDQLTQLYNSCSNEEAKSNALSPLMSVNCESDLGGLKSTPPGWSDAVYRIVVSSDSANKNQITGEGALMMHRDDVDDHGCYLSHFHRGMSPEEALDQALDSSNSINTMSSFQHQRSVSIRLTEDQQSRYFEKPKPGDDTFYELTIRPSSQSAGRGSSAITMHTECGSLISKELHIFELEGSELVDMIEEVSTKHKGSDFVKLAHLIATRINARCKDHCRCAAGNRKIVLLCGLQPALDSHAKKSGYRVETKAVLDMALADVMLRFDLTVIQALRKKTEDRVNVVKQLAMACFHFGLTTCSISTNMSVML